MTPQTIARENAQLLVRSSVDPVLQWEDEVHTDLTGSRVLASAGARIRAFWPKDTETLASSPPVILLRCRHLGLEEELPLHEIDQDSGWLEAELQSSLACWPAGIFAISASLHRQGSRRAQARSSIVLWNGLRYRRNGVFRLDRIPDPCPNELELPKDLHGVVARFPRQLARTCLLPFQDHGRTRQLQYPAPGVHVAILGQGGSSEAQWRPLGSEIPISALSTEHAIIHTDQPGKLVMGTLTVPISARKRLPLVLLHNHLGEATSLEFVGENGTRTEVLRCSTVHVVEGKSFGWTKQEDGSSVLIIRFKAPMRHVEVKAFHLPSTTERSFSWQFQMPVLQCSLPIPCNELDDGPWMLYGLANNGATTGMLVDDQQRPVAKELVVGAMPAEIQPLGQAQSLLQQLRRIHHLLRTFWARPPRGLVREWEQRVQQLATTKRPSILMALLLIEHRRELAEPPEAGLRPRHLGGEVLAMYTLPARRYRQLPASNAHPLLVCKTLSCAGDVLLALQQQSLSPAAFTFLHGNSGKTLLLNYCSTIEQMPLQWRGADPPSQEHCLGREHLVHAIDRFACQLQEAISRNDDAANKALALRATVDWGGFQARLKPLKKTASSEDVETLAALALKELPEFEGQDFLIRGMHLLASLALACRMETRHPGILQDWLKDTKHRHVDTPFKPALAFFLVAGEDLFFYFLLLWEVALESLAASA